MSSVLLERREGGIAVITINRPKALNAIDLSVIDGLEVVIDELSKDSSVRAAVLCGAGGKAFVAGADIAWMKDLTPIQAETFAGRGQGIFDRIAGLPFPVIAAVGGFALGGGCELAMAADMIFAGADAKFGQPEVKLGVIPGFAGTQRLVRRVGSAIALDLCLTGRMIDAQEAFTIGLVSRVVDGDVFEAAIKAAGKIARNGPVAVRLCKRAIHENMDSDLKSASAAERSLFGLCFSTADQTEGMAAFVEKRRATFTGE